MDAAIRPFRINVPDEALVDLRRGIRATRWPDRETVTDESQGVQLATIQELASYWAADYDWRKVEARLNGLPQFTTEIDGVDIHFIHVRSKDDHALPLIVTHGGPGRSVNSSRSLISQGELTGYIAYRSAVQGRRIHFHQRVNVIGAAIAQGKPAFDVKAVAILVHVVPHSNRDSVHDAVAHGVLEKHGR